MMNDKSYSSNIVSLKLENINFKYSSDKEAPLILHNINLEFFHGEYITVIGHNGSGKSTLSKILMGILKPKSGNIYLFDKIANQEDELFKKHLGIVFQNPDNQFIGSTARDDIAFGLENKCVPPSEMNTIIENISRRIGIEDYLDHEATSLSGGQKQKVAIASILALNPDIIILDEATSMLDPKGKRDVYEIINFLKQTRGKTIISITHNMSEILTADRVVVINKGECIALETPQKLLQN
jgi:energy-coupling factor transport system ATP-binding protein